MGQKNGQEEHEDVKPQRKYQKEKRRTPEKIRYSNKRQNINTLSAIYGQYLGQKFL